MLFNPPGWTHRKGASKHMCVPSVITTHKRADCKMGDAGDSLGTSFAGVAPKKKITEFVHWARPKSSLYEYNYDYGSYYYKPMIEYLNQRSLGARADTPKPLLWEERALKSYIDRNRRVDSCRFSRDHILLQQIRASNNHYIIHAKSNARKITGTGF